MFSAAYQTFVEMQRRLSDFIMSAIMTTRRSHDDPGEGGGGIGIPLFIRKRKYDEAETRCEVQIKGAPLKIGCKSVTVVEPSCQKKQKVLVTEASWLISIKKTAANVAEKVLTLIGAQPTYLKAIETTAAECVREVHERQICMPYDDMIDTTAARIIDLHIHDDHGANHRSERASKKQYPGRAEIGISCDAHKKAQIITEGMKPIRPFDSQVVRLGLSFKGGLKAKIKTEMRLIILEQCRVMIDEVNIEADAHRKAIYDLYLGGNTPREQWRRKVVERLFNGDIRKRDVIEHIEKGCCKSPSHTRMLMCTIGVEALMPRKGVVGKLDRKTGRALATQ